MLGSDGEETDETAERSHCQRAWQVLGTQEVIYGRSMGTGCERRALPAGTGAKAHPGQMAAPETQWTTGHQPSRPHMLTGGPEAGSPRCAAQLAECGRVLWMSGTDAVGRALAVPEKHPSRVAPVSG